MNGVTGTASHASRRVKNGAETTATNGARGARNVVQWLGSRLGQHRCEGG